METLSNARSGQEPPPWIVQKYGGTSIGKLLDAITSSIVPEHLKSYNVAVVCSARSKSSKAKGTTSLLLQTIQYAWCMSAEYSPEKVDLTLNAIRNEHLEAARVVFANSPDTPENDSLLSSLEADLSEDLASINMPLESICDMKNLSDGAQDSVLALGETMACRLMTASLKSRGVDAKLVSLGGIVQDAYPGRTPDRLRAEFVENPSRFLQGLVAPIKKRIDACDARVPIVPGESRFASLCSRYNV